VTFVMTAKLDARDELVVGLEEAIPLRREM
jgi:hypothetical protein